jgi:[acyl-carrier-protein] S-malonyltransferase
MGKIAVVFPGQGSQFIGMYKALVDEYEIVRETIREAEQVTGIHLSELCFRGPLSLLSKAEHAHVAIVAFGVAAFRVFVSETGLTPQFCTGHSLGEYTAMVCAGVLKLSDALKLVQIRSEISAEVQQASDGCMTIVDGIESTLVQYICKQQQLNGKNVYVSCYNSRTQTAISGINADVEDTEGILLEHGATVSPLFFSAPFHCPIMEQGTEKLRDAISKMKLGEFRYPVISNFTGKPYQSIWDVEENLIKHLTSPVKWDSIIQYLEKKGIHFVIDFSARNIFETILNDHETLKTICFGVRGERDAALKLFQGPEFESNKSTFISKCILAAISTPNRNFNDESYDRGVVINYQKLYEISIELEKGEMIYSQRVKKDVLQLVTKIFETKMLSIHEQLQWFQQILDETASNYQDII